MCCHSNGILLAPLDLHHQLRGGVTSFRFSHRYRSSRRQSPAQGCAYEPIWIGNACRYRHFVTVITDRSRAIRNGYRTSGP